MKKKQQLKWSQKKKEEAEIQNLMQKQKITLHQ